LLCRLSDIVAPNLAEVLVNDAGAVLGTFAPQITVLGDIAANAKRGKNADAISQVR